MEIFIIIQIVIVIYFSFMEHWQEHFKCFHLPVFNYTSLKIFGPLFIYIFTIYFIFIWKSYRDEERETSSIPWFIAQMAATVTGGLINSKRQYTKALLGIIVQFLKF